MKAPTVAQMKNRALDFHRQIVKALAAGKTWPGPNARAFEIRGAITARRTLTRWGALDANGLTERGRELAAAFDAPASSACTRERWCVRQVGHAGDCSPTFAVTP